VVLGGISRRHGGLKFNADGALQGRWCFAEIRVQTVEVPHKGTGIAAQKQPAISTGLTDVVVLIGVFVIRNRPLLAVETVRQSGYTSDRMGAERYPLQDRYEGEVENSFRSTACLAYLLDTPQRQHDKRRPGSIDSPQLRVSLVQCGPASSAFDHCRVTHSTCVSLVLKIFVVGIIVGVTESLQKALRKCTDTLCK